MKGTASNYGQLIGFILARFWCDSRPPVELSDEELTSLTPLLIKTGAGALGWWQIRDSVPSSHPSASELHQSYRFHTIQAAVRLDRIKRLFRHLRTADLDALLVKGWAVARLYPQPGLRPYIDLDLVLRPEDFLVWKELQAHLSDGDYLIDPHRGFDKLDDLSTDELYGRSKLVNVDDVQIRVLCDEDHLRVICLHMLRHGALRPLWLCDIAALLASRSEDFDWDRCLGKNRRRSDWIACSIGLAHQLLGVDVTGTPVERRARNLPKWLVPAILKQWEAPYPPWRYHEPMEIYLRKPMGLFRGLKNRWPNPIEATSSVNGPFNEWPRLPFQIGNCILRATKFIVDLSKTPAQ